MNIEFECKLERFIEELELIEIVDNSPVVGRILSNEELKEKIEYLIRESRRFGEPIVRVCISEDGKKISLSYSYDCSLGNIGTANELMSIKLDGQGNLTCDDCNAFFFYSYKYETNELILKYERTVWNKRGLCILKQQYENRYDNLASYDEKYREIKTIQQLTEAKQGEDFMFLPVFGRPHLSRFGVEESLIESSRITYPMYHNNPTIEIFCRLKDNPHVIIKEWIKPSRSIFSIGSCVVLEVCNLLSFRDKKSLAIKYPKSGWAVNYDCFPCFRGMKIEEVIAFLKKKNVNSISLAFRNALARINEKHSQKTR